MQEDKLVQAIAKLHEIELKPSGKRTDVDEEEYKEAKAFLSENWKEIYEHKTKDIFMKILFPDFNESHFSSTLHEDTCKPPPMRNTKDVDQLNRMIQHIYSAQTTIGPMLQELVSMTNYANALLKRAKSIFRVLYTCGETEWKIDAMFELLLSEKVAHRIHMLNYYVSAYEIRDKQLEKARRDISRLLTSYTESLKSHVEPMSRSVPEGLNSAKFRQ